MIKKHGGIFGRNPTFNNVTVDGSLAINGPITINGDVFSGLDYDGTWNASTNTPTLTSSVGTIGHFYIVSVAGSTNLDGETAWQVGDWAVFNGSVWQKVDGGSTGLLTTLTVTGNTFLATTSGNVGVGTTSPDARLRVNGTAKIGEGAASNTSKLMVNTVSGVAAGIQLFQDANESWIIQNPASTTALTFANSGSEQMRLTSTGLGIGTSSPSAKLTLKAASNVAALRIVQDNNENYGYSLQANSSNGNFQLNRYSLGSDASTFATLDSSGNLGLAVTPSASVNDAGPQFQINNLAMGQVVGFDVSHFSTNAFHSAAGQNWKYIGSASATQYRQSSGQHEWLTAPPGTAGSAISFTQDMTLNSTGLGVGTSSPAAKFEVANTSGNVAAILRSSNSGYSELYFADVADNAASAISYEHATNILRLYNGGSAQVYLDSPGNLGLGVTPSAWGGAYTKAFQMSGGGGLVNNQANDIHLFNNCYYNGTNWIYVTTNPSSRYEQFNGGHYWLTAPPGTAGNAISFTQDMTFGSDGNLAVGSTSTGNARIFSYINDAALPAIIARQDGAAPIQTWQGPSGTEHARITSGGNLLVGGTSPVLSTANRGNITITGSASSIVSVGTSASAYTYLYHDASGAEVWNNQNTYLRFGTNNTERARIPAAGGMVVGTAALATSATDGFLYVPTCAGTPTGTPTTQTGTAPIVIDTTNNKLYFYSGGQWRDAGP